jgi:hypothetical protein
MTRTSFYIPAGRAGKTVMLSPFIRRNFFEGFAVAPVIQLLRRTKLWRH